MAYQPIQEWIELDRSESATTASTLLYNALAAKKASVINLGQGREIVEFGVLQDFFRAELEVALNNNEKFIDSKYNPLPAQVNALSADFLRAIFRVDAVKEATHTLQTTGRASLLPAIRMIIREHQTKRRNQTPYTPRFLVPDEYWPMLKDVFDLAGITPIKYSLNSPTMAKDIDALLEKHKNIVGMYFEINNNPTGRRKTTKDCQELSDVLNKHNSGEYLDNRQGAKIGLLFDLPYLHACPEIKVGGKRTLDTGLQVFTRDQATPWVMSSSGSKDLGTASPGLHWEVASKEYETPLKKAVMSGPGVSYMPQFLRAVGKMVQPKYYGDFLDHCGKILNGKYRPNRSFLEKSGLDIVEGDPSMTQLFRIQAKEFAGRVMHKSHDGPEFIIRDFNDVVEYAANKHGVVIVNSGNKGGYWQGRLAAAPQVDDYAEGVRRVVAALDEIRSAPFAPK
jgi:hypothetical protein